MDNIRWLHISDLHFGKQGDSREQIRDSLLNYLKEKQWEIDYIFITGDLIYAPEVKNDNLRKESYNRAYEFIYKLYLTICNDDNKTNMWKRVFIVPGNHDVIRSTSRSNDVDGIKKDYFDSSHTKIDDSYNDSLSKGIQGYLSSLPKERVEVQPQSKDTNHYIIKTDKLNILHLNSCIASGKEKEEGSLIIGSLLLENVIKDIDRNLPTIAIAHHNIDCLDKTEQKKIELILKKNNIYLYLCGHTHERESNLILRYNQSEILNTFTAGTLMNQYEKNDIVILRGEMDTFAHEGRVHSYKWDEEYGWTEDNDFGLAQGENQGNERRFKTGNIFGPLYSKINDEKKNVKNEGVTSIIVQHTAPERTRAFTDVNEKATSSLSVYGIGITHVSKDKILMNRILKTGGSIRLCMMNPAVLKTGHCKNLIIDNETLSSVRIKIDNCELGDLNFCIGATHMDSYIREEYADDVQKSFDRIMKYKKEIEDNNWDFHIRLLSSFVPISINIINEKKNEAELIAEYNMPFVEKRLLLRLKRSQSINYFEELSGVFEAIWDRSTEV